MITGREFNRDSELNRRGEQLAESKRFDELACVDEILTLCDVVRHVTSWADT